MGQTISGQDVRPETNHSDEIVRPTPNQFEEIVCPEYEVVRTDIAQPVDTFDLCSPNKDNKWGETNKDAEGGIDGAEALLRNEGEYVEDEWSNFEPDHDPTYANHREYDDDDIPF